MPTDYYNEYRKSLQSSNLCESGELGSFDPLILSITLPEKIELGLTNDDKPTPTRILNFGTYLHENMHWYQCIGTTYGLFRLLSSMAQTLCVFRYCRQIKDTRLEKPLYQFLVNSPPDGSNLGLQLNFAVNTWMDIEFANAFFEAPNLHVERIANDQFFGGLNHGALTYFGESFGLLSSCFPKSIKNTSFYQDSRKCIELGFKNANNLEISVPPLGASDIMESAAHISEIQYIQYSSSKSYSWISFKRLGYLDTKYLKAFNIFLNVTRLNIDDPCSPVVNLFLLICDIALNPSHGYPDVFSSWEDYVEKWHPGFRFFKICNYLANITNLTKWISSRNEGDNEDISNEICEAIGFETPISVAVKCQKILRSFGDETLEKEVDAYESSSPNFPARYLVGKHIKAMQVRQERPYFFAMPANDVRGDRDHRETITKLIESISPPFIRRKYSGIEMVIPKYNHVDENVLMRFHSTFARWLILLSLGRQLTVKRGPFKYAHKWTDSSKSDEDMKSFVENNFEKMSGHDLKHIRVLD
jgi:hypothetical protein